MGEGYPNTSSAAAREGTALHELAHQCLEQEVKAVEFESIKFSNEGTPDEMELNEEQQEVVQAVVDYVVATPGSKLYEQKVSYGRAIGQDPKLAFGTADYVVLDGEDLHVMDAKFGRRFVDCFENTQMLLYGIGVVDALETLGDEIKTISFHILQPRVGGKVAKDPWVITRTELDEWIDLLKDKAVMVAKAIETFAPENKVWQQDFLEPSEDACFYCPAAAACPALEQVTKEPAAQVAHSAEDGEFAPLTVTDKLSGRVLAQKLRVIPLLEIFIKAVQAEAYRALSDGQEVEGFKMILGRQGHRRWADEQAALAKAQELGLTKDQAQAEPKLKSPAQLQKTLAEIVDKDAAKAIVDDLVVRNAAKPTMVKSEVPGEPWNGAADMSEFE